MMYRCFFNAYYHSYCSVHGIHTCCVWVCMSCYENSCCARLRSCRVNCVILKIADQSRAGSHFNSPNTHSQFRNSQFTRAPHCTHFLVWPVVVGHGTRTGTHLANWALKAAGFSCSTTTAGSWFQSPTVLT